MDIVRVDLTKPDSASTTEARYDAYRRLVDRVVDAFGDEILASKWLSTPSSDFNSVSPLEVAQQFGYDLGTLEHALIRIEHGVDF